MDSQSIIYLDFLEFLVDAKSIKKLYSLGRGLLFITGGSLRACWRARDASWFCLRLGQRKVVTRSMAVSCASTPFCLAFFDIKSTHISAMLVASKLVNPLCLIFYLHISA